MMSTAWGARKTDCALLSALICFRLLNGFFLRSTFHPDEEWQSTEVAHSITFGFGFLTWEWEKCIALRSVAHPAIFAVMFWILKQLLLDFPDVIAVAPRLLQSVVAAVTDYGAIQLANEWYGGALTAHSEGEDLPSMTALRSQKGESVMKTQDNSRGNDSMVTGDACDPISTTESLANSTERNSQCRLQIEAGDFPSQSVTGVILHWVARIYHASGLADVTKGANVVRWITLCSLLSWFNFFCLPRTFSNCFEAFLNVYALLFFAHAQRGEKRKGGRSVTSRPSAASRSPELQGSYAARVSSIGPSTSYDWKTFAAVETQEEICDGRRVHEGGGYGKVRTERKLLSVSSLSSPQQFHSPTFCTFLALSCAALSVVMRPPAAMFWTVFCLCKIFQQLKGQPSLTEDLEGNIAEERMGRVAIFLGLCFIVGTAAVGCNLYLDYLFYGKLTFPPLNFVKFNMLMDPGRFFGAYPWHYYLLECPVVVLLTFYPFFALGVMFWLETLYELAANCYARKVQRTGNKGTRALEIARYLTLSIVSRDDGAALLGTLWSLLLLSFSTHKEYRFMISYMPVLLTYVGIGIAGFVSGDAQLFTALGGERKRPDAAHVRHAKAKRFLRLASRHRTTTLLVVFGAQVLFAIYFGLFHRRGTPPVMHFLRHLPEGSSVFFLSPTHELPYYSQLHRRFPMGFLDCSPRLRRQLNFPENWQTRFWAAERKSDYLNFLDSLFIPASNPQQILVSPSAGSHRSRPSTVPSESSRVSPCPAPLPFRSLSSIFSPTSQVPTPTVPAFESSAASLTSTDLPSASLSWETRTRQLGTVNASASASWDWMRSDIYSQIPHESEGLSFSFADFVFSGVKRKKNERETVNVASRSGATEEQQNVLFSSKVGSAKGEESSNNSSAVENSWFGDAAQFRKQLCRLHRWPHSKNCEVSPSFEECLDYRFLVPLYGQLPTHFVLTSYIYEKIPEWFSSRGYIIKLGPVFDSIVAESPRGKVFWQYFYVLERRPPASSMALA